jgi:hypothetical protein
VAASVEDIGKECLEKEFEKELGIRERERERL